MQDLLPLKKYKEILDTTPVCTVDVLFFNKDKTKTLLFKRENEPMRNIYFSAGGRLLKNESIEDCAVRKAQQETGLTVARIKLTFGGFIEEIHPNSIFENVSYHAVDFFYGYILEDEKIELDSQHSDYKWFSVSDEFLHPFIKIKITTLLKKYGQEL